MVKFLGVMCSPVKCSPNCRHNIIYNAGPCQVCECMDSKFLIFFMKSLSENGSKCFLIMHNFTCNVLVKKYLKMKMSFGTM